MPKIRIVKSLFKPAIIKEEPSDVDQDEVTLMSPKAKKKKKSKTKDCESNLLTNVETIGSPKAKKPKIENAQECVEEKKVLLKDIALKYESDAPLSQTFYHVYLEHGNHKINLEKKFWRKLDTFLIQHDFELPAINRYKYRRWPLHLPPSNKVEELQKVYPELTTKGDLSEKKSQKILRRFDRLVDYLGYDKENGGRNKLIDKLHNKKYPKNLRYKALVAAYVAGPKLLKKRFARDIWNRLEIIISRLSKTEYDKNQLYEEVIKMKKQNKNEPFVEARNSLGLSHSEEPLNIVKKKYYRMLQAEIYGKRNKLTLEEKGILMQSVFKFLGVKNVSSIPRCCKAPWKEIAVEIDKNPDFVLRYWERNMYPKLLAHEELGEIFEDNSYIFKIIAEKVIEDGRPLSKISIPELTEKVRYSNTNTVGAFVKKIDRLPNGLSFQENMNEELLKLKTRQHGQHRIRHMDLLEDVKLTELYDQLKSENFQPKNFAKSLKVIKER